MMAPSVRRLQPKVGLRSGPTRVAHAHSRDALIDPIRCPDPERRAWRWLTPDPVWSGAARGSSATLRARCPGSVFHAKQGTFSE